MTTMTFTFPWPSRALSPNWAGHWAAKAMAKKAYRATCSRIVHETDCQAISLPPDAAIRVVLRAYPPTKRSRDWDNVLASMKSGLDGLADGLGVDDKLFRPSIEVMDEIKGVVVVEVEVL